MLHASTLMYNLQYTIHTVWACTPAKIYIWIVSHNKFSWQIDALLARNNNLGMENWMITSVPEEKLMVSFPFQAGREDSLHGESSHLCTLVSRLGRDTVYSVYATVQKPNSWTYNFVEVSGHDLESSQTWGFFMDFLTLREVVWFSVRFSSFLLYSAQ